MIRDSYGDELLDNSKRKTINEIKWCIEKDFIQQALTLVESKMPKEIIEHNFLYCKELFDVTPSGTIIKKSEKEHLNDDNSPKQRWESVENYIFQKFGWTKLNITVDIPIAISIRPKKILPGKAAATASVNTRKKRKTLTF